MKIKKIKFLNNKNENVRGITLIALVITIIVLLILAGVSIAMLTGENGVLTKANESKDETKISEEKEQINLSYSSGMLDSEGEYVDAKNMEDELKELSGLDGIKVTDNGDGSLTVYFPDTGHYYLVSNGSIKEIEIYDEEEFEEVELGDVNVLVSNVNTNSVTVYADKEITNAKKYVYYYKPSLSSNYFYGGESNTYNEKVTISDLNQKNTYKIILMTLDNKEEYINSSKNIATVIAYDKAEINQTYSENRTYIDSKGYTASIPAGAKAISEGTNLIEDGLVTGLNNSEFVWVPINIATTSSEKEKEKFKIMATKDENGNYKATLYNFDEEGNSEILNSTFGEPKLTTYDAQYLYIMNNILGASYSSTTEWLNTLNSDYNNMVNSVQKYGGFYIARYETSLTANNIAQSVKNVRPITATTTSTRNNGEELKWYGLYALQKAYTTDIGINSVSSSMVWGSQWDAILNWGTTTDEAYKIYSNISEEVYTRQSGSNENDKMLNIYDLQGNYIDITLECAQESFRTSRGRVASEYAPMYNRAGRFPHSGEQGNPIRIITSRMSLYIN